MFEPLMDDMDELKLAVSLPDLDATQHGHFIPLSDLSEANLTNPVFDALFVSGLSREARQSLSELCDKLGTELVEFESPADDLTAINDVVQNLAGKLYAHEMPNNIDVADIRYLNQCSNYLFAFNNKCAALGFLAVQELGEVMGGVYLAHGNTELSVYEATNNELLQHFSEHGFLCSSFYSAGRSECTILLGLKC